MIFFKPWNFYEIVCTQRFDGRFLVIFFVFVRVDRKLTEIRRFSIGKIGCFLRKLNYLIHECNVPNI